jgi:4-hydroxy-tetrahydrodipicolinate reductase
VTLRIAIVGPGAMGRAVADVARAGGHRVVAEIGPGSLTRDNLDGADVAIEFTEPAAAAPNLLALAGWGVPTVCGTTGWTDRLAEVTAAVERAGTALVHAPNFATGVQLFARLARATGALLAARPEFSAYLLEVHHERKKDAPSGTARLLRDALRAADASREYPITSIRIGPVPGVHELHLETEGEGLTLSHVARDRTIYARGALLAAEWLRASERRGVFTFEEVLFGGASR